MNMPPIMKAKNTHINDPQTAMPIRNRKSTMSTIPIANEKMLMATRASMASIKEPTELSTAPLSSLAPRPS
eukprot:2282540-Pyramimonas_sp.AAC.1